VKRIETMWVMVVEEGGEEGIPAIQGPDNMVLPLVGSDCSKLDHYRHIAQQIADDEGKPVRLLCFMERREIDVLEPRQDDAGKSRQIIKETSEQFRDAITRLEKK